MPIYQTATFSSGDADELGRVAADPRAGYAYSRISNPTTTALGDAYAELAGGEAGLALASGMGAIHAALASLLQAGDRVVAPVAMYGSTRTQLLRRFGGFGVRIDIVDTTDLDAVEAALAQGPTRVLYAETIANPTTFLADHAALAELAHRHGAAYVVDNTFASPYVCRPLELGADLVVESATKFLGGHSDVIAGVVAGSTRTDRRGRPRADRHRRDAGAAGSVPGPARHPDARRPGRSTRPHGEQPRVLAGDPTRASGRSCIRAWRAIPSMRSPSASSGRASSAACSRSRSRAAGRPAARSSTPSVCPS